MKDPISPTAKERLNYAALVRKKTILSNGTTGGENFKLSDFLSSKNAKQDQLKFSHPDSRVYKQRKQIKLEEYLSKVLWMLKDKLIASFKIVKW